MPNNLWIEQYGEDVKSISSIEKSLDKLAETIDLGDYDEKLHREIVNTAKELKNKILNNQDYDEDKKWMLISLINANFQSTRIKIDELVEELVYFKKD